MRDDLSDLPSPIHKKNLPKELGTKFFLVAERNMVRNKPLPLNKSQIDFPSQGEQSFEMFSYVNKLNNHVVSSGRNQIVEQLSHKPNDLIQEVIITNNKTEINNAQVPMV